jgi:lipopolysaccharide export system protein LptA
VIELRGRSTVTPVPGQEATVPEMRARDIDLAFHEGTQALERAVLVGGSSMVLVEGNGRRSIEATDITLTTAPDGRTVTHLDARERVTVRTPAQAKQAARTITSSNLVASGNDAGLTDATFTGGVRFVETTPAGAGRQAGERVGTSQALTMKLGGQLDAVESAQFQQNVQFRDGDVSGGADIGDYAASAGRLTLRPGRVPSRLPRVTSGRVTVDARELIDVDLNTQNLHARGDVKTVSTPEAGARGRGRGAGADNGLFTSGETMFGFGAEFWYEGEAGRVRYRGAEKTAARVTQGDTVIVGASIDLSEETQDLTANGSVESTFLVVDSRRPSAAPTKYRVQADTLEYRDKARTATYTGAPVTLTVPDGVTRARTMVMTLAAEGRTLERLDARTEVHAVMPKGREALADSLLYEAAVDRYTLRGVRGRSQVVLRSEGDTPGTCSQSIGLMVHLTSGEPPVFPPEENPGNVQRTTVACTGSLR